MQIGTRPDRWAAAADSAPGRAAGIAALCLVAASVALPARAAPLPPVVQAALDSAGRLPGDREQDQRRRVGEVLAFLDARPGMRVLDAFAAGGYCTELLSRIVGPGGEVIAYNNEAYAAFGRRKIAERYANGRLPNVRQVTVAVEKLELPPASLDAAIFVMAYHDLYWRPSDGSWAPTDPRVLLRTLYAALKPGGVVLVQDHVAAPGGDPTEVVNALHRIDPARVRADFEAVGLRFDASSTVLAHPEDDHTKLVFDPAIQGRTDQFVYRFVKPGR
jgi:predicted methyltransferase